jgi:hypothetical protein
MYYDPVERPRVSRGLLIGGVSVLGGSYLFAAAVGALTIGYDENECTDCQDVAPWLFLPLVGPFVGATRADAGAGAFVLLGAVQVAGAGLLAGGIVRFKRTKRRVEEAGFANFALPHGRRLAIDLVSSPRFSGPELTLRF